MTFRGKGTYAFVDGNYLYGTLREAVKAVYDCEPVWQGLYTFGTIEKLFFFDALGPDAEASEEERERIRFHETLKSQPGHHLRHGSSVRRTGKRNRGVIQQKQVDVLLAVTIMEYAFRGVAKNVIIFAGDQDFVPLVESLVGFGVPVEVIGYAKNLSRELIDAADSHNAIDSYSTLKLHDGHNRHDISQSRHKFKDIEWFPGGELGYTQAGKRYVTPLNDEGKRITGTDRDLVLKIARWSGHTPAAADAWE